jgi:N-acetyl-anhydromuramyl-L-alanine amidase AmpD
MIDFNKIPFVQARQYTKVDLSTPRKIRFIVIHSMESQEKGETAENVAHYFKNLTRPASAHYCIDNNSIVQCVQTKDVAYGASSLNRNGVHLELAGRARQTEAEWLDPYSKAMLDNAAQLCGKILVPKFKLPVVWVKADGLKLSTTKGFTSHAEGSKAFNPGGHWDPGPGFPVNYFLDRVAHFSL